MYKAEVGCGLDMVKRLNGGVFAQWTDSKRIIDKGLSTPK